MPSLLNIVRPRALINPVSRLALATFAWNHRHEILRWGRSMYEQLIGRADVSPARAIRIGRVLFAIASHPDLRDARQLRKVTMVDDEVDLDVDPTWSQLPRLVERVRAVKGVSRVVVNGAPDTAATARALSSAS
jgi:hypothetical protein